MRCPSPACPFLARHGRAAAYRADVVTCTDCGTALVGDDAPSPVQSVAGTASPVATTTRPWPWVKAGVVFFLAAVMPMVLTVLPIGLIDAPGPAMGGLIMLGVTPWIAGAFLVELVAMLVPRWRPLRHRGPRGRARLDRATLLMGFIATSAITAVTAWSWDASSAKVAGLETFSVPEYVVVVVAGACIYRVVAAGIARTGAGNGFSVVIAAGALSLLVSALASSTKAVAMGEMTTTEVGIGVACVVMVAVAVWRLVQPDNDVDDDRTPFVVRPSAGIIPVSIGARIAGFVVAVVTPFAAGVDPLVVGAVVLAVVTAVLVPVVARMVASTGEAARSAMPATWALNAVLLVAMVLSFNLPMFVDLFSVAVLVAVIRDVVTEARARSVTPGLVSVWPVHRFDHVGPLRAALREAGIATTLRGAHHRALFHVFVPVVPVEFLVDGVDAERATAILEARAASLPGT